MTGNKQTILSEHFFNRFDRYFAPYLGALGISAEVLTRPDVEIPEEVYARLWQAVAKGEGDAIALTIGSQTVPEDLGPFGHAIRSAPTVSLALETLSRFIPVYAQAKRITIVEKADQLIVTYQITDPGINCRQHVNEFALSCILSIIQSITASNVRPERVDLEHAQPDDIQGYQQVFGCPLRFNRSLNRLFFPVSLKERPVPRSDISLFHALQPFLEHQLTLRGQEDLFQLTVRGVISDNLSNTPPSLRQISEQLACSPRTLQRRLQRVGVEFNQLVDDVRREAAISYIHKTRYSLTEIAQRIGYTESSAFSRAFRRWTGQSPQQFRQQSASHLHAAVAASASVTAPVSETSTGATTSV